MVVREVKLLLCSVGLKNKGDVDWLEWTKVIDIMDS
jgi:hypothetical protein